MTPFYILHSAIDVFKNICVKENAECNFVWVFEQLDEISIPDFIVRNAQSAGVAKY